MCTHPGLWRKRPACELLSANLLGVCAGALYSAVLTSVEQARQPARVLFLDPRRAGMFPHSKWETPGPEITGRAWAAGPRPAAIPHDKALSAAV